MSALQQLHRLDCVEACQTVVMWNSPVTDTCEQHLALSNAKTISPRCGQRQLLGWTVCKVDIANANTFHQSLHPDSLSRYRDISSLGVELPPNYLRTTSELPPNYLRQSYALRRHLRVYFPRFTAQHTIKRVQRGRRC